jgi:DNA-binding winged helix-turn-helix (wHTH) protein
VAFRFGEYLLDVDARRLFRGSHEVHLSPKAFELLRLLVETRPRALTKADLLERIWPGVFVSESSLTRVVNEVRSALDDAARQPRIVRTVHGYGYAFAAEVDGDDRLAASRVAKALGGGCWLVFGRRELPLTDGEHVVGREADADICLASPKVSRRHASLKVTGMHATIEDLKSKNGTSVRGERISSTVALEPGDEIEIGPFTLVFRSGVDATSTETEIVRTSAAGRPPLLRRKGSGDAGWRARRSVGHEPPGEAD